ncbi:hypothetical protein BDN70DRAFT_992128 [Pholiota conissans]|uniref:Homeobox domain-containing protein n=1 Tax=Pholiota conissans TaxID=109636 RepID=A0A9P5Z5W0_9AGAR|nr:hypothetical protein BDN70DRAFT_992128 [Pholiota conissans]
MENVSSGGTRNITVIRASPAQTAILMQEFAISDTPTAEKLKDLSDQTNLPYKWLHNWFGRQRTKANKTKAKVRKAYTGSYAHDPNLSPQELLRIKLEHADADAVSTSSSSAEIASVFDGAAMSASSSGTLEASVASEPPFKRRGRPPQIKDSPALTLRRTELIESSAGLEHTQIETDSDARTAAPGSDARNLATMVAPYNQLIPNIAPPRRTPMNPPKRATGFRNRAVRSALAVSQPESIYMHNSAASDFSLNAAIATHSTIAGAQRPQKATSQFIPGPVFHTQFQNNMPENFPVARALPSAPLNGFFTPNFFPGTSFSMPAMTFPDIPQPVIRHAQPFNAAIYNEIYDVMPLAPLAPAFDWNNNAPPTANVAMLPNHGVIPHVFEHNQFFDDSATTSCQPFYAETRVYNEGQAPQLTILETKPEKIDTLLLDSLKDAINPSLAPLKHLTEILHEYKDELGTYARLLAFEESDNIKKCLLDEKLMKNNPFQAAMALALLSKLGFEWEY